MSNEAQRRMNGQADLLLGYVMDQAIKLQDATKKPVHPIRFADYGVNMISSGIIVNTETLKTKPDMVKRFLRATTRALEESEKNPKPQSTPCSKPTPKRAYEKR